MEDRSPRPPVTDDSSSHDWKKTVDPSLQSDRQKQKKEKKEREEREKKEKKEKKERERQEKKERKRREEAEGGGGGRSRSGSALSSIGDSVKKLIKSPRPGEESSPRASLDRQDVPSDPVTTGSGSSSASRSAGLRPPSDEQLSAGRASVDQPGALVRKGSGLDGSQKGVLRKGSSLGRLVNRAVSIVAPGDTPPSSDPVPSSAAMEAVASSSSVATAHEPPKRLAVPPLLKKSGSGGVKSDDSSSESKRKDGSGSTTSYLATAKPIPPEQRLKCSPPMIDNYDYLIKMVLIGDSGVGKSNLLSRLTRDVFEEDHKSTIGVEFATYTIATYDKKYVKAQIWDTAGQERFRAITQAYYRGALGAIVVYDVSNPASYDRLKSWIAETQQYCGQQKPEDQPLIMIIGNKVDLPPDKDRIETLRVSTWCSSNNYMFFETSAKTGFKVKDAFNEFIRTVYEQRVSGSKPLTESQKKRPYVMSASKPVAPQQRSSDEERSSASSSEKKKGNRKDSESNAAQRESSTQTSTANEDKSRDGIITLDQQPATATTTNDLKDKKPASSGCRC